MNHNRYCIELAKALLGSKGEMDSYLEVKSEDELKHEIIELMECNKQTSEEPDRHQLALIAINKMNNFNTREAARANVRVGYEFADEMIKYRKT